MLLKPTLEARVQLDMFLNANFAIQETCVPPVKSI
jgi:hypothetical protein